MPASTGHAPSRRAANAASITGPRHNAGNSAAVLKTVLNCLDDAKAENTVTIDLAGKSSIGDHMVVSSGRSDRHVGAIADQLTRKVRESGFGRVRVEGLPNCDWVLIDIGDVIVHVFRPEVRDFYNLEKMWQAAQPEEMSTAPLDPANDATPPDKA